MTPASMPGDNGQNFRGSPRRGETLEGRCVSLRPPLANEGIAHLFYLDDPLTMEHLWFMLPHKGYWEHEDVSRRLQGFIAANDSGKGMVRSIYHLADQRIIGQVGLVNIDQRNDSAELGVIVHNHYWGTPVTAEACLLVLKTAFEDYKLHRVAMRTPSDNRRCQQFLKHFGCAHEATLSDVYKKGARYVDEAVLSLLQDEWPEARRRLQDKARKPAPHDKAMTVAPVAIQGI